MHILSRESATVTKYLTEYKRQFYLVHVAPPLRALMTCRQSVQHHAIRSPDCVGISVPGQILSAQLGGDEAIRAVGQELIHGRGYG